MSIKTSKYDVIIPCFNDGKTLLGIIDEIKRSKNTGQIIVVDDGSDNETKKILRKLKGIKLLTHEKNLGKADAILSGVLSAQLEKVVLLDSDLINFRMPDLDEMVNKSKNYEMTLGYWGDITFFSKFIGFSLAYTGMRVIDRKTLLQNKEVFKNGGYLFEPSLNQLLMKEGKVGLADISEVRQIYKIQKEGLVGFSKDLKMWFSIMNFLGRKEFLRQLKFARDLKSQYLH